MKQLLTLLLFVFGTAAFANSNEQVSPSPSGESYQNINTSAKKAVKSVKADEATAKATAPKDIQQKERLQKGTTTKLCNNTEGSHIGLSGYFVDFVHETNVKLVKLFM
ncbi:hypothetical protein D3C87_345530 [compost metagenome]